MTRDSTPITLLIASELLPRSYRSRRPATLGFWQPHFHRRPFRQVAFYPISETQDSRVPAYHERADDREPEPTARLGGRVACEIFLFQVIRHAFSVVCYGQLAELSRRPRLGIDIL